MQSRKMWFVIAAVGLVSILRGDLQSTAVDDAPSAPNAVEATAPSPASPPAVQTPAVQPPATQPPVNQARTVSINTLAYYGSGGKSRGDSTPVRVTAGGTEGNRVRVGFFETEVGGFGDQWRAAGWMAAVNAALITDFDPRAMHISFEYEGRVDGPSAGGLMTVGVLAAVRGDTPRPDAAMTGTINPDGTIGPVGGMIYKIQGAAAKNMKLVLIPAGIRFERNDAGENIDLIEHGKKLGVEVRPVSDVYAAYEDLTGVELPRPPAARLPRISQEAQKQVEKKIAGWYDLYTAGLNEYSKMPGKAKLVQEAVDMYKEGLELINHADKMRAEGEVSAAFWDYIHAAVCSQVALELGKCRQWYSQSGYRASIDRLRNNGWLDNEVQRTARRMRDDPPRTLDQLSMYFHAVDAFLEGASLQVVAKNILDGLPNAETEEAKEAIVTAASYQVIAWLNMRLARDYLDLGESYGGTRIAGNVPWGDIHDYFRRASRANLAGFDACVIKDYAKAASMTIEDYREDLMTKDISYAMLQTASTSVFPKMPEYLGDGDASGYAQLACYLYVYTRAAGLLAKYYSLGVELDDNKNVVGLTKERLLNEWLSFAEDQSRRSIALLKKAGIDTTACVQLHDIARIKSRRELDDKLNALTEFWSVDLHAQVLRRIGAAVATP